MSITGPHTGCLADPHPFDADTASRRGVDGARTATISPRWTALSGTPNGGYLLAMAVNALQEDIDRPVALVASGFFLRPATPGAATLDTDVVREGRRTATGQARLAQDGREVMRITATFGDLGDGAPAHTAVLPPDLPPPEDCIDPLAGMDRSGITMLEQIQYRTPQLPGWMVGQPSGQPVWEFWMGLVGREADVAALPMLVDTGPPVVLELGEKGSTTVELTVHIRARPAAGWLACRAATRHVRDGYHEEDFDIWDSTGALVAQSRQFAILA